MKLQPADTEDLADARRVAVEQLIGIDQRKQAAADAPPVVKCHGNVRNVLRDIVISTAGQVPMTGRRAATLHSRSSPFSSNEGFQQAVL